jgi:hypothetical protein
MPTSQESTRYYPVRLTEAQRKVVADIAPELVGRLKLEERDQRVVSFTPTELNALRIKLGPAIRQADSGMKRTSLRFARDFVTKALEQSSGIGAIPARERLYQFKITLLGIHPPTWRRVQVKDCTLDKLHERIQTAMGWTNSHLNHFTIDGQLFGDPLLMEENYFEMGYEDSTSTKISQVLPRTGERFRFEYEYDFGDSWRHEVLFEGCLRAQPGCRYPLCLEGERACPPDDVGGISGYVSFLQSLADPDHDEHESSLMWAGGRFDPKEFDSTKATKRMRRGLPDWRKMLW